MYCRSNIDWDWLNGLKAWLTKIKDLASEETKRQEIASAAGRELLPALPHISASFALMEKASISEGAIERLQRLMQDEKDDEMKALFKNQLKEATKALAAAAALDAEEQVLT